MWNNEVKAYVPAERLLTFNVKQGYEPLCKFLGKSLPKKEKFPHVNETDEFKKIIKILGIADKVGKFVIAPAIALGVGFLAMKLLK